MTATLDTRYTDHRNQNFQDADLSGLNLAGSIFPVAPWPAAT